MMTRLFFIGFFSFSLFSCGNSDEVLVADKGNISKAILVDSFDPYKDSADTEIKAVTLGEDDLLIIEFSYSGGCEKHEFQLIGSQAVMKSLPPKRSIRIYHNSNGDACRELIDTTIRFDISQLRYNDSETHLILEGWEETILYK